MDFDWDNAKERANRKKHGIGFRVATRVFLDPHAVEFDDRDARGELRFNAIGLVDGRMLFVTYTVRGDVVRIISARADPVRAEAPERVNLLVKQSAEAISRSLRDRETL